jgi:aminomethyltransferase
MTDSSASQGAALRSPLHDRHVAAGAKFADFGGYAMPLQYPTGIVEEHTAVRSGVGVFDVSHLGKASVVGPGAADYVNAVLSNDLRRIGPGKAQYTLCCDASGGVVDDLIAYLRSDDDLLLVPNAANTAEVVRRIAATAPEGVTVTNRHREFAVLAVQGPRSADLLAALDLPHEHDYMAFVDVDWRGVPLTVCRTGYTGEHGYELLVPAEHATAVWDALLAAGEPHGAVPCGLGARDTLRTEMGYPLHGQDLSLDISPVQARLGWAVGWKKDAFWGRDALIAERAAGPRRALWGIKAVDRAIPRAGMPLLAAGSDTEIGVLTSGTFSPTLKVGIGLALIDAGIAEGDAVRVDVRGRPADAVVVKPPFVTPATR